MRRPLMAEILDMGGGRKGLPRRLVSNQPSLSRIGWFHRGVGRSCRPYPWSPKDACSKRLEIGNWKLNMVKNQGSVPKPKVTFDMLFDKYSEQKAVRSNRPLRSPPHQERPSSPPRTAVRFGVESSQRQHFTPAWAPSS
jgi:hypothetical protein